MTLAFAVQTAVAATTVDYLSTGHEAGGILDQNSTASASSSMSDPFCTIMCDPDNWCDDSKHTRALPVEVRARCQTEEVPDDRTGASYRVNAFVGVCPSPPPGQEPVPDEQCFVGVPRNLDRTGLAVDDTALVPDSNVIPNTMVTIIDLGDVCIEQLLPECIPLAVQTEGRKTTIFNDQDGPREADVWMADDDEPVFVNPPQVCHSTHQRDDDVDDEHKCKTGTGAGDATVEDTSPTSWVGKSD